MLEKINKAAIDKFNLEIQTMCHEDLRECYQCGKCSAGCSSNWLMDYRPNQLMRLAQLGQRKTILSSKAIWMCTGCQICTTRCPRQIDIAHIIDAFRELAVKEDAPLGDHDIPLFHQYFLKEIRDHGRLHELSLVANFKMHSDHPLSDFALGPKLMAKGKIKLIDMSRGLGVEDLQDLFDLKV